MKNKKTKKIILIIFLVLICLVLIQIYKTPILEENSYNESENLLVEKTITKTATLLINDKKYESVIENKTNIYHFMNQLRNEEKIDFKEKTYSGMGKFINEINGIKNKDKNWIYYVNGKKATIGISNYKINPGDVVSWKYEDSY